MTEKIEERKRRRVFPETFKREAVDRAQTSRAARSASS
jgi:hypothetical protein